MGILLISLLLYFITKCRLFYWTSIILIIVYLAILAFTIGVFMPLLGSIL